MCWSMTTSVVMVGIGTAATSLAIANKQPKGIWITIGYFTFMEFLQASGYAVIDECDSTSNQAITLLSFLHIVFQPFFINAFSMELVPTPVKMRIRHYVYFLCSISSAIMLVQLYPFEWAGKCYEGEVLCGSAYCLTSGDWHIAWHIPYSGLLHPVGDIIGIDSGFPTYILTAFFLPLVYGAWRMTLFHLIAGPVVAWSLTSNSNEAPAIWCLFSIGIILIGCSPLINKRFRTTKWWAWPNAWNVRP